MINQFSTNFFEKRRKQLAGVAILALLIQILVPFLVQPAHAVGGTLTYTEVRFDRMKTSTATTGVVCAKQTSAGTATTVAVTYPTGYTLGLAATFTTGTTNTGWPKDPADGTTTATAWPGIGTATNVTGQVVTFPSTALTVGTWYCFNWINSAAVQTKSSATTNNTGTVVVQASGPTTIDTGNYATSTIAKDQVAITATVPPSFSFTLSTNAAALGTLSLAAPNTAGVNGVISTNAARGWNMWAADPGTTPGLTSAIAAYTIAYSPTVGSASAVLANGAEGMNLGVATTGGWTGTCNGTKTADPNFVATAGNQGGGLDGTLRNLALTTGTANACTVGMTIAASMNGTTPAAPDYQGTMTFVAAGRF